MSNNNISGCTITVTNQPDEKQAQCVKYVAMAMMEHSKALAELAKSIKTGDIIEPVGIKLENSKDY